MWNLETKENPVTTVEKREFTMGKDSGGLSVIGNNLGIRKGYLEWLPLGTSRYNDIFSVELKSDGSVTLTKKRETNIEPWEKQINESFVLPEEAVYKNIEPGPSSFQHISFTRKPKENKYILTDSKWVPTNIAIDTKNLDEFKKEVDAISGKIIIECSSRKNQWELACEITPKLDLPNAFRLNSTDFFDFFCFFL